MTSEANRQQSNRIAPKMIGARPVLAPKRYCACNPPAPWHIGIAPNGLSKMFATPEEIAKLRSFATAPVVGNQLAGKRGRDDHGIGQGKR